MGQQNPFSIKKSLAPSRRFYAVTGIGVAILMILGIFVWIQSSSPKPSITNFDECARAGYPVMESYPRQCQTPDGKVFVEEIGREGKDGCRITGCSSQICSDQEVITTCEVLPEDVCYKNAVCERQSNGECDWTQTSELAQCLQEQRGQTSIDTAGWQTYRNDEFGFEVKYYSESEPQENIGNEINGQFTYLLLVRFGTNPIKSTYGYELRVNKRQSLNSYREELVGHIADKIDSEEQIVINDNTWTKINYQIFLTTDYVPVTMVITNHGGYTYAITSSAVDTDQILSTFRFIE